MRSYPKSGRCLNDGAQLGQVRGESKATGLHGEGTGARAVGAGVVPSAGAGNGRGCGPEVRAQV